MDEKITNINLEEFMHDHLERSEIFLLEQGGKEADDIMAVAEAKGYILKDSNDLAGFKTIYTFDTAANINKARLPKELLLKALPGIIGKPVDIDHNRIYVVGHYIDYRYVASKHMVIAYGVFYKSNFGEEWEKAKELFKAGKLGTSYEIWCPKSKRKYLPDGSYILMNIEIAGGGLMFKEKPAFPDAKVLELAKKNMDEHTNELMFACDIKKTYAPDEIIVSGRNVYDALVQPVNKTTIPVSDRLYTADELIGKPVGTKTLPAGMKVSTQTQGFEKPVIGLPNPAHTQVGVAATPGSSATNAPGNLTSLAEKNALQNTGLQPQCLNNDNLKDNVSVPGPQITACIKCANCAKEFNHSPQTFQRKNSIDFYEVARTDDMHQCPGCKAIVNRQGYMLHPPQIVDFGMACPSCRSSNWRILKAENPETSDVKCMNCQKQYHLAFAKEQSNKYVTRLPWLREGISSCPQCGHSIPYSTVSTVEHKSLLCPKCNLHYGINLTKAGSTRKVERANEFVTQEENERIGDGSGGSGTERAAAKHTTPPQKFVPRSNQQIVDQMACQIVDDQLTKNLKEDIKMSEPNTQEVKQETAAVDQTPAVEAPKVETPTPTVEQPAAPVTEEPPEVEDAEAVENEEVLEVSKTLKTEDRNKLSDDDFAVTKTVKDKKTGGTRTIRKYPIHDKAHVQNALARLHQEPSREGLKKLGVNPDSVIEKVKAKGKKLGMETADMEGYCVSGKKPTEASKGSDMQTVVKRGKDNVQETSPKNPNNYVGASAEGIEEAKKVKKEKTGDDGVAGLTPDQVNQMQNQLFANTQKAMRYRKFQKAAIKNLKALKKAMADGVFCSVQDPDEEVVKNMDIDGKKTTTVSNDNEKPTDAVTTGSAPAPDATPTVVNNDQDVAAKAKATALIPAKLDEAVEVVVAPATPVENMEVQSKGKTPTDTTSDGKAVKVDSPAPAVEATDMGNDSKVNLDVNQAAEAFAKQLIPTVTGDALKPGTDLTPIAKETPVAPMANAEVPGKGEETPVSTTSDAHVSGPKGDGSSTELLVAMQKENESLKEKINLLETAAVKIIDRRNALGEFGKDLSDKDILDDAKFEVAKIKAENKDLKRKLNSASAHIAETGSVRGETETKRLAREINEKANRLY